MNKSDSRNNLLVAELKKQQALARIWKSEDFQAYLMPEIHQANKWLDPQAFESDALFQRAYNTIWAKAQIANEIIKLLSEADQRIVEINNMITSK